MLRSIFGISIGYLFGSIPTAYLAGRWIKGIDLREYGSGTASVSMVWEHVAHWALFPVALFDIIKAAFAAWLGMKLGDGVTVATIAGLAAVIGHNWSIFLNFTGGRGLSPFIGVLLVVFPLGLPWLVAFLAVGYFLGDSAPWALVSLITMPFLVNWKGGAEVIGWSAVTMVIITLVKRLEANGRLLPEEAGERRRTIFMRLLFDRDISSHSEWIKRRPNEH
jgi:glycerol-3-phosphate acyltransferase PlsY